MRRILCALLMICLMAGTGAGLADTRTPKPIDTVPYEEVSPLIEGQHHYLLLCTDVLRSSPDFVRHMFTWSDFYRLWSITIGSSFF